MGKITMLVVPLFLGCCGMTMLSALVFPDTDPAPESTGVDNRLATVDIAADAPTAEPPTSAPTDEPNPVPATATARPSATPPPSSPIPTAQPTAEPPLTAPPVQAATTVAATVAASQPTAAPSVAQATAVPPTIASTIVPPTAVPPTTAPPENPLPTENLSTAAGALVIIGVDKRAEVVTIRNGGGAEVNLAGWILRSENGPQDCDLGGVLSPSQTLRIWVMTEDIAQGGYNRGFGSDIWNNSEPDAALLIDPSGAVVSRW